VSSYERYDIPISTLTFVTSGSCGPKLGAQGVLVVERASKSQQILELLAFARARTTSAVQHWHTSMQYCADSTLALRSSGTALSSALYSWYPWSWAARIIIPCTECRSVLFRKSSCVPRLVRRSRGKNLKLDPIHVKDFTLFGPQTATRARD